MISLTVGGIWLLSARVERRQVGCEIPIAERTLGLEAGGDGCGAFRLGTGITSRFR